MVKAACGRCMVFKGQDKKHGVVCPNPAEWPIPISILHGDIKGTDHFRIRQKPDSTMETA